MTEPQTFSYFQLSEWCCCCFRGCDSQAGLWHFLLSSLLSPPSHPFVTSPSRPVRRRTTRASCCPPSWRPPCWLKTAKSSVCSKTSSGCSSRYRKSRRRRPIRSWSWNASWPTRRRLSRWAVREGDGRLVGPRRRDFYRREIKLLLCFFFFSISEIRS